jgi:hypothetical protein
MGWSDIKCRSLTPPAQGVPNRQILYGTRGCQSTQVPNRIIPVTGDINFAIILSIWEIKFTGVVWIFDPCFSHRPTTPLQFLWSLIDYPGMWYDLRLKMLGHKMPEIIKFQLAVNSFEYSIPNKWPDAWILYHISQVHFLPLILNPKSPEMVQDWARKLCVSEL